MTVGEPHDQPLSMTRVLEGQFAAAAQVPGQPAVDRAECQFAASGRVRCQSADRALKGVFTPARSGGYRFTFLARRLALGGPFGPPAGVTVSDARSIDRAGSIAVCTTTAAGMTCRQP